MSTEIGASSMVSPLKYALAILRLKQVEDRTGLKKSSVYKKSSEGTFPTQIKLGARAVGWIESEIDEWIAAQVEKSRGDSTSGYGHGGDRRPTMAETEATFRNPSSKVLPQPGHPPKYQSPSPPAETNTPFGSTIASSRKGRRRHE